MVNYSDAQQQSRTVPTPSFISNNEEHLCGYIIILQCNKNQVLGFEIFTNSIFFKGTLEGSSLGLSANNWTPQLALALAGCLPGDENIYSKVTG